jgi:hypothetical protein
VPRKPRRLTSCNCSICRRYGTLWAYYRPAQVEVRAPRRALQAYSWGTRELNFFRCGTCGCITHWEAKSPSTGDRMGVNARNFDPACIQAVRVRRFDGAASRKFLD